MARIVFAVETRYHRIEIPDDEIDDAGVDLAAYATSRVNADLDGEPEYSDLRLAIADPLVLDHLDAAAALCADPIRPDPAAGWGHVVVDRDAQPHRFESADAAIRSLAPQAPADGLEPAL